MNTSVYFYHTPGKDGVKTKRYTIAGIVEGNVIKMAASACSLNDQFVKRVGRRIALQRAENVPYSRVAIESSALPGLAFVQLAKIFAERLKTEELQIRKGKVFINPNLAYADLQISE